jgi:lipopolysaccharide/colanic/teichoic acid biosynthesis glycosyltransferase
MDLSYAAGVTVRRWSTETWERRLKVGWERTAAALLLLLLSPLLLVLLVAIRLDSAGPAVFRQVRVGRGGQHFTMYKLRTMTAGADASLAELRAGNEADGPLFKLRADPRITRLGRSLRRYSLDELPQLWNVVRGEMALVGPRPALPEEVATYDQLAARRLVVRPGVTGLWQVSGRSDLPWHTAVGLDARYVERWSLALDLTILVRTFRAVWSHSGAY